MSQPTYFLTWTTYGTWLPGDARGWVKSGEWGIQLPDPERECDARQRMAESAVVLALEQRILVEQTIRDHCRIRGWVLHAVNARTNHVHVVVTADRMPNDVMKELKAWCSRKLSDQAGLSAVVAQKAGRRRWFTEGGDKQPIKDDQHLGDVVHYVIEGQ